MSVTVTFEKQTHKGLLRKTERTWVANNGHVVTVKTDSNTACLTTWAGRQAAYAHVYYTCECGRTKSANGQPKKAELDNHDSWFTPEQIAESYAVIKAVWESN